MSKNGYFQLVQDNNRLLLKVVPPENGGSMFELDELIQYLDRKKKKYVLVDVSRYIRNGLFDKPFLLGEDDGFAEDEDMQLTILSQAMSATVRFYPPSTNGKQISKEEILRTIHSRGIKYGVKESVIDEFLNNRRYCMDYVVAEATEPVQGRDAEIIYHFDTNVTAKPKLNEDGSVDFHKLGNIKPVRAGDKLATLIPAENGKAGMNILGNELSPKKVSVKRLRYGRNIELSEDRCEIISTVAGHVTLVDDMVVVSDIYYVPRNVDASTGDIEYSGSVEIPGNVLTGYSIKADGDIIVNGVVEGAMIESGGNVVLKNGMQGMGRGKVKAKGNVIAKYLENCDVEAGGDVISDAMMHTDVTCKGNIEVTGRRGLITGGHIKTYGNITVTTLGSNMGTDTRIEIISEMEMAKKVRELEIEKEEKATQVKKMDQIFVAYGAKVKNGEKLSAEQEAAVKKMLVQRKDVIRALTEMDEEIEQLNGLIESCRDVSIRVHGDVYSGVKIIIKDIMKIMNENVSHCRFIREGADIRITAL